MEDKFFAWLNSDKTADKPGFAQVRQRLLYKFNSRWYLSNEDVDDCVQETFKRVLQNLEQGKIPPDVKPMAYILKVADNVLKEVLDAKKKKSAKQEPLGQESDSAATNPEDQIFMAIELARYLKCLKKCFQHGLTPDKRDLISMFYENDCHFNEEILARFDEPTTALSVRLHRIRAELKPCVEKCLGSD